MSRRTLCNHKSNKCIKHYLGKLHPMVVVVLALHDDIEYINISLWRGMELRESILQQEGKRGCTVVLGIKSF